MSQYIWEVKVKNTPLLKKKCNHCDSSRFRCSDKFRLNARKKNIDIWLIYRCIQCNNRYNMALFSRIKTESISKELFNQLSENNVNTAWEYAFSHDTRRKNNVEADLESVEYEILYDDSWIENTISSDNEMMIFTIKSLFDFNLTISSVIRTCLKISSSTLDRLVNGEAIFVGGKPLQKKRKVRNGDIVQVNTEQLRRQCQDIR